MNTPASPVKPIPVGYHTATPYLIVGDGARAIEFYRRAFGAVERLRLAGPDGRIMHAEIQIGDSILMLAGEYPEMGAKSPATLGGSPVFLHLYVPDVDRLFAQALAAGAREMRPVQNQFYGDRSGMLTDPFGHCWNLSTHVEDVSPAETTRRAAAHCGGAQGNKDTH